MLNIQAKQCNRELNFRRADFKGSTNVSHFSQNNLPVSKNQNINFKGGKFSGGTKPLLIAAGTLAVAIAACCVHPIAALAVGFAGCIATVKNLKH